MSLKKSDLEEILILEIIKSKANDLNQSCISIDEIVEVYSLLLETNKKKVWNIINTLIDKNFISTIKKGKGKNKTIYLIEK